MKFLKFTIAFLVFTTALVFIIPTDNYYIDLVQSFTFHAMLGYAVLCLLLALLRWKFATITAAFVSIILAIHLLPHISSVGNSYDSTTVVATGNKTFKVAHFNVLGSNRHFSEIIKNSMNLDADILSFQEVERAWALQLMDGLEDQYPYFAITEHDVHGVAIFSKYPITNLETYNWTGEPTLTGDFIYDNKAVHFVATHTLSPRSPQRFENRNEHLSKLADYVNSLEGPILAIGDFNAVPWNKSIQNIKHTTDLIDSRKGIASTYPANYSIGLPIDYIFHSDELNCINFEVIEAIGSDHKGIYGEYAFNTPKMLVDMN